jgi:pimeloyl-ACP methyl ester carboxylesterase
VALAALAGAAVAQPTVGLQQDVVFTAYSPLSANAELARRALSPLTGERMAAALRRQGAALAEQPVELSSERFVVYVPAHPPASGYGLVVFITPWPKAELPPEWRPVFDQAGVIFVSAANAGNDQTTLGRREPLAVLAATNVIARYPVDKSRVYVAGLSGGSRVAMRVAIAYPDLFRGAILNAGSDPVGADAPLPPRELMQPLQEASRFVYLTGGDDSAVLADDAASRQSLRTVCMFNLDVEALPGMGHDLAPPFALARALKLLDTPPKVDAVRLAACRAALDRAIGARLDAAEALLAAGERAKALAALDQIDRRWGGLAAPHSVALFERAEAP